MTLKNVFKYAVLTALLFVPVAIQADNEAWVEYSAATKTLTFHYDDRKEASTATAKYSLPDTSNRYPRWLTHRDSIETVVFDKSFADARPTICYGWFGEMIFLESIKGIKYLNTSEVTDMSAMFEECYNLAEIDLTSFNTSNVTDMSGMFNMCTSLTSLDLTSFNTAAVTDMSDMFYGCSSLTDIYAGSGFVVSNVTESDNMFTRCTSLPHYDSNKTDKEMASSDNGYLTKIDDDTEAWAEYDDTAKTLTFHFDGNRTASTATAAYPIASESLSKPEWLAYSTSIEKVAFDDRFSCTRPTSCSDWFSGMSNLKEIEGLANLNTSKVASMERMFSGCQSLTSLDLSHFNTSSTETMLGMFANCKGLTQLDLSSFDTSSATILTEMFTGCSALKTIYASDLFTVSSTCVGYYMFNGCTSLTDFDSSKIGKEMANCTDGYFSEKPIMWVGIDDATSTMTFYYNAKKDATEATAKYNVPVGKGFPGWFDDYHDKIQTVVFDSSFADARPTVCYGWLARMTNLTAIEGIENLNTSCATYLGGFFYSCCKLASIDLSHFDTSNVTDMEVMFGECDSLEHIDLSTFNTSKVTNMAHMFNGCKKLASIDVSHFDTSNVNDMADMFLDCQSLKILDLSSFNTEKVTDFSYFLDGCYSLATVNLTNLNTSSATDMSCMFYGCKSLKELDLSSFDTEAVTNMKHMFRDCTGFENLDLSSFKTPNLISTYYMFNGCTNLKSIDMSNTDFSKIEDCGYMFNGCTSLENIYVGKDGKVPDGTGNEVFVGCSKLANFDSNKISHKMANYTDGYFTLRRHFTVGGSQYNADGVDAVCHDDVTFGDKDEFISDFSFKFAEDNTATYERTVSSKWATLCLPFSFDVADVSDCKFYTVNTIGTDKITVDQITETVAAGKPILVYADNGSISIKSASEANVVAEPADDANMEGTFVTADVTNDAGNYIISKNKFWNVPSLVTSSKAESVKMSPYRAYITAGTSGEAKAASLYIVTDETDGISDINADDTLQLLDGAEFYDMQGQRITTPVKGLVIVKKGNVTRKLLFN